MHEYVDALGGIFVALVRQMEGEHGGFAVGMAHVPLHSAEVDARFEQRGGLGLAERMASDVACDDARPLGRTASRRRRAGRRCADAA